MEEYFTKKEVCLGRGEIWPDAMETAFGFQVIIPHPWQINSLLDVFAACFAKYIFQFPVFVGETQTDWYWLGIRVIKNKIQFFHQQKNSKTLPKKTCIFWKKFCRYRGLENSSTDFTSKVHPNGWQRLSVGWWSPHHYFNHQKKIRLFTAKLLGFGVSI